MADLFQLESTADVSSSSTSGSPRTGTDLSTGALRRKYNFGDRVSELAIASDPFFRLVSKVSKSPTDDPEFKFTERRPSFHKRYAYPVAVYNSSGSLVETGALGAALTASNFSTFKIRMATDYKSSGNVQNVYGQSGGEITVGADGTQPAFYLEDQLIKINVAAAVPASIAAAVASDYAVMKVSKVTTIDGAGTFDEGIVDNSQQCDMVELEGTIVRDAGSTMDSLSVPASGGGAASGFGGTSVYGSSISSALENMRSYVIGTAHAQGSGYPSTWKDQPFVTGYGRTQIWKTAMAMDNTTRATVLKYESNEFARVWREKLIEHKWDIEQSILFGSQYDSGSEWYTQGAVDFISSYGNVFSLTHASKTQDDFLDDLSNFLDPRYNNANASLFFCDTATYNWLHKLSGYFSNNLEVSSNFRADMSLTGKKKVFGVDISVISTPYGDMNVARNIHLDGSPVKLLACNMRYCAYRPLVGNGLNRDTAIYVGVQTLENSGVDRRVDLIQTEAGMEWQMPEAHAYWS